MVSLDLEHGHGDSEVYLFKRAGAEGRVCDLPRRARRFARIMRAHLGARLVDRTEVCGAGRRWGLCVGSKRNTP